MGVKKSGKTAVVVPMERITQTTLLRRGHKVILDDDLAAHYEVETKTLNRAVKTESRSVSGRFHVPAYHRGVRQLEVPIWHLKFEVTNWHLKIGRPTLPALRLHGAGRGHALQRSAQRPRHPCQHRDHARLRALTARLHGCTTPGDRHGWWKVEQCRSNCRDGGGTSPWMGEGRTMQEQLSRTASGTAVEEVRAHGWAR